MPIDNPKPNEEWESALMSGPKAIVIARDGDEVRYLMGYPLKEQTMGVGEFRLCFKFVRALPPAPVMGEDDEQTCEA